MDYLPNIQRAVEYIEQNLMNKITLNDIAREACFSMYHFHRIFHAFVGESAVNYIRKRRLTKAADQLLNTDNDIIMIAFDYQFESQASFTRSFKKLFGITPGRYRTRNIRAQTYEKKELTPQRLLHYNGGITMQPEIITKKAFNVVGMRCKTTQKNNIIPDLWQKFLPRLTEIKHAVHGTKPISYGICEVDPNFTGEFNEDTEFTYVAGVEVDSFDDLPEGMVTKQLNEQQYAVFTHTGPMANLQTTFDYIYGTWLPNSGYELAGTDDFEYYDESFTDVVDPDCKFYLYIPVRKK